MRRVLAALSLVACSQTGTQQFSVVDADALADAAVDAALPPPDTTPPAFSGLTSATADTAYSLRLGWTAAGDDNTDVNFIEYRAYVAEAAGGEDFSRPASVIWGTSGGVVGALAPNTDYFVVVRAVDLAGNIDGNSVEQMVHTPAAPPVRSFSGQIAPILHQHCTEVTCHNSTDLAENMSFSTAQSAYAALVGVQAVFRSQLLRVAPGDSGQSYVVRKVLHLVAAQGEGDYMPPPGATGAQLSDAEVGLLREWIDQGAANN